MGGEICTDNRFEIIAAYKKKLIEGTNIESSPDEMAVIDNILFRFWQMDWLPPIPHGRLIEAERLKEVFHRNVASGEAFDQLIDIAPTIIPAIEEGEA